MKAETRKRWTISLVLLSIILHLLSFYTSIKGWGSIYPFFTWKLYSQPAVTTYEASEYRIYSKKENQKYFVRNPILPLKDFTDDDYIYTLNFYINQTLADTNNITDARKKLCTFVKHAVPGAEEYKIVKETYHPLNIIRHPQSLDTTTVIFLK